MSRINLGNILNVDKIQNELELAEASHLYAISRVQMKKDSSIKSKRYHLANLIEAYEKEYWSDESKITDEQIKESDEAEKIVAERNKKL